MPGLSLSSEAKGEGLSDLSTVSSRFRPVEILESIVEPSRVISDQYKPVSVATTDGKVYNGYPSSRWDEPGAFAVRRYKVTIPRPRSTTRKNPSFP